MSEPSPHLDLDALADALAGEAADAEHLRSCASCTSRLAELEAAEARVVQALSTLPPPQLPDAVGDRIAAALAAEPPLRPAGAAAGSTVTPLAPRRERRSWLPAVAAAAVLVFGAGLGYTLLEGAGGGSDSGSADTATAGGAVAPDLPLNSSGIDWADADAVRGVLPEVVDGTAGEARLLDSTGAEVQAPAAATEQDDEAASTFSSEAGASVAAADPLERLRTPEGLASCLSGLLPPEEPGLQPVALDYASYAGQPALAVLLPDPEPGQLSVFLVGAGCTQGDEDLLHFVRVPRP